MTRVVAPMSIVDSLAKLRQIVQLISAIQSLPEPITTPDGLQQAITDLVQLAGLLGINSQWIDRVNSLLADPATFDVVLSVVRYVLQTASSASTGTSSPSTAPATSHRHGQLVHASAWNMADWLPLIEDILSIIQQIRSGQ